MILLVAGRRHPILGSGHDSKHLTVSMDTAESLEKPVAPTLDLQLPEIRNILEDKVGGELGL